MLAQQERVRHVGNIRMETVEELREFVNNTLCDHEKLELGAYPTTEHILFRAGTPCGLLFCLQGPRSVRFTAIWETDGNTILFYGSSGRRFATARLISAPRLHDSRNTSSMVERN